MYGIEHLSFPGSFLRKMSPVEPSLKHGTPPIHLSQPAPRATINPGSSGEYPVNPIANPKLALVLLLIAVPVFAQAPPTSSNLRQSALSFEQQGKLSESETAWRTILKSQPGDPEPYAHLGLLAARQERYSDAVPLYRKALALKPTLPGLRLNLGLALFKQGDLKAAIPEFNSLLKTAPPSSPEAMRRAVSKNRCRC
jgi:cytochrome c-type biogenesis protein CcmH/NrfG